MGINGDAEKGVPEGTPCTCNTRKSPSCKKHPSREKVPTGRTVGKGRNRRAEWAPKALVEAGHVEVEEPAEECA